MNFIQPTKAEAIDAAARVYARALRDLVELPPRQSAEAAYIPGGPSVDELQRLIEVRLAGATTIADTTAGAE